MCILGLLLLTVDWMPVGFIILVHQNTTTPISALHNLRGLSADSHDDLMLMACSLPQSQLPAPENVPLQPQLLPPAQGGDPNELWGFGSLQLQLPATGKLACCLLFLLPVNSDFRLPRWFSAFLFHFAWLWHTFPLLGI